MFEDFLVYLFDNFMLVLILECFENFIILIVFEFFFVEENFNVYKMVEIFKR